MLRKLNWRKLNWAEILLFCLVISPACFLGFLLLKYSVDVPYWDQWNSPGDALENISQGQFSIADLFSQHNEHRIFFPKLIFIGLAFLTGWNTKYEILLTFLLACATSLNIYGLSRLSGEGDRVQLALLAFISNLLIFSTVQYENWLWGFQSILLFPIFYITSCLLVASSKLSLRIKLILCTGLSVASSFSLSNGLFCWIAFLLAFIFSKHWLGFKQKRNILLVWASGFLLTLLLYFHGYQKPGGHPGLGDVIADPHRAVAYFFSFLGAPLTTFNSHLALPCGVVVFCLFASLALYTFYRTRQTWSFIHQAGNWLIIGLFALASALAATVGRSGFGVEQAFSARYTSFSIYLVVTIVQLGAIVARSFFQYTPSSGLESGHGLAAALPLKTVNLKLRSAVVLSVVLTTISILTLLSSASSIQAMQNFSQERRYGRACLTFVNFVDEQCITEALFPNASFLKNRVHVVESMNFIDPDLAKAPELEKSVSVKRPSNQKYGVFDVLSPANPGEYTVTGWAILPGKHKLADAVLLTYKPEIGKPTVFAVAPVKSTRPDVANALKDNAYLNAGWATTFSDKNLPAGNLRINAWALDLESRNAYRLKKVHKLQRS